MGSGTWTTIAVVTTRVESANESHIAAIAAIERESFSDPWSEQSFKTLAESESSTFLVAVDPEEKVVGYAAAFHALEDGEILNVAVASGARRLGIGGLLLDAALERLRSSNVRNVYLEVRESNLAAQSLYRSRGFSRLSLRRNYYRRPVENALVFRLELAPG